MESAWCLAITRACAAGHGSINPGVMGVYRAAV